MTAFLGKYEAIVEIIFAIALSVALVYSICVGDKVTAAAVIGGILGYMKGRSDLARAVSDGPPAASGEAGFASIRLLGALVLGTMLFSGVGCSTIRHTMNADTPESILQAQDNAQAVVMGFQAAFKVTPEIVDALLKNGTVTPHLYNTEILPAYNKGLASLGLVVKALRAAQDARQDPNHSGAYLAALSQFLADKAAVDAMLNVFGRGAK